MAVPDPATPASETNAFANSNAFAYGYTDANSASLAVPDPATLASEANAFANSNAFANGYTDADPSSLAVPVPASMAFVSELTVGNRDSL